MFKKNWYQKKEKEKIGLKLTLASGLTVGLAANSTSVAFKIVFSSKIVACDWLCPNGY